MRVLQFRGDGDLAQKALPSHRGGDFRTHDLERHGPIVLTVHGPIHDRHSTRAELAIDGVSIAECRSEAAIQSGSG